MQLYTVSVPVTDGAALTKILATLKTAGFKYARVGLNPKLSTVDMPMSRQPIPAPVTAATPQGELPLGTSDSDNYVPTNRGGGGVHKAHDIKYAHGIQNKGISGEALVVSIVGSESRVFTIDEIEKIFVAHKFNPTSARPTADKASRDGLVKRVAPGRFCVPGLVIRR